MWGSLLLPLWPSRAFDREAGGGFTLESNGASMENVFEARRERLRRAMRQKGIDALLVSGAANRYYLSGFELHDVQFNESSGRLIVTTGGCDILLTDPRYEEAALALWPAEGLRICRGDSAGETARALGELGSRIGVESAGVAWAFIRSLSKAGPALSLEAADGLVEGLRAIKDEAEIAALRRSFALNHRMLEWLEGELAPGRTEREISWAIERFFRENGAEELAFPSIVAVDRNAAMPHAVPGDAAIPENGLVLVDVGCRVDGYCSDQTRTFEIGCCPAPAFARTFALVEDAQRTAIRGMRPGMPFCEAYGLAMKVFEDAGEAGAFTHGLGHGVGLETHERPSLSTRGTGVLQPGMVVTVEPGLYYPAWGGVRREHTVLVTEDGVEVL